MAFSSQKAPAFNPVRFFLFIGGMLLITNVFGTRVGRHTYLLSGTGLLVALAFAAIVIWTPGKTKTAGTGGLQAVSDHGINVRVSSFPVRNVLVPWSAVERAEPVIASQSQRNGTSYDVGLWLREPVGPFSADPTVIEPHIRLNAWRDGVGSQELLQKVQAHLSGGAPGSLSIRAEAHYLPGGGSDLFELHLYPGAPGYLTRFRTHEHGQAQEVQRDLSPGESIRIQQDLADRGAFSLPSVDDPYPDGIRGQIVLQRGEEKHTIELHSVAEDNASRALLTYLLELAPLPLPVAPTASATPLPSRS